LDICHEIKLGKRGHGRRADRSQTRICQVPSVVSSCEQLLHEKMNAIAARKH
jgi:hypothetical protein